MRRLGTSVAILCALVSVLAASPAARAAEPGVVLTTLGNVPETVAHVQAIRARHVRMFLSWRGVGPPPGSPRPGPAPYDELGGRARAGGVRAHLRLHQAPPPAPPGG